MRPCIQHETFTRLFLLQNPSKISVSNTIGLMLASSFTQAPSAAPLPPLPPSPRTACAHSRCAWKTWNWCRRRGPHRCLRRGIHASFRVSTKNWKGQERCLCKMVPSSYHQWVRNRIYGINEWRFPQLSCKQQVLLPKTTPTITFYDCVIAVQINYQEEQGIFPKTTPTIILWGSSSALGNMISFIAIIVGTPEIVAMPIPNECGRLRSPK